MNELAAGVAGANKYYGNAHNPWDVTAWPGGSSSGERRGRRRQPVPRRDRNGHRHLGPGPRRVVRHRGHPAYLRTGERRRRLSTRIQLRHDRSACAPTVADAATLLNAMVGYDPSDKYSVQSPKRTSRPDCRGTYAASASESSRISLTGTSTPKRPTPCAERFEKLASLGAQVKQVRIPLFEEQDQLLLPPDDPSLRVQSDPGRRVPHRRQEPFRPGCPGKHGGAVARSRRRRTRRRSPSARKRSRNSRRVSRMWTRSSRRRIPSWRRFRPSTRKARNGCRQFTVPVSFTGLPAVSVPCGFSPSGLPIGLHIVGKRDAGSLAPQDRPRGFEAATDFHRRKPPLYCS